MLSPVQFHRLNQQNASLLEAWATTTRLLTEHPYSPFTYVPGSNWASASAQVVHGLVKEYPKPEFGITSVKTPRKTVDVQLTSMGERPFCNLLHFEKDTPTKGPKVLLVAPLAGHYATLLRDTVTSMLQDHDVFITDWKSPREVPKSKGEFTLSSFMHDVMWSLRTIGPGCHLMAVCQPGPASIASLALMTEDNDPAKPRSLIVMGSPIDTRVSTTAVNKYAASKSLEWFKDNVIDVVDPSYPGAGRIVYPAQLQLMSFMAMNAEKHMKSQQELLVHLAKGEKEKADKTQNFYNEFMAVMDLPGEYFLDTLRTVFKEHHLPQGKMVYHDPLKGARPVIVGSIRDTALMTVEGEKDDICGKGQTEAAHAVAHRVHSSRRAHHEQKDVGHYGLFSGSTWREEIYPRVRDFIHAHDHNRPAPLLRLVR